MKRKIAEILDPTLMPMQIISDFLGNLSKLGVWCADRAALILMIKIDKLKTREKYERHFLSLSVLFSFMVRIGKLWDDMYRDMMDTEELATFSRPKLSRLVEPLNSFSPAITSYATPAVEVVKEKEAGAEKQEAAPAPPRPRRVVGRRAGQIWRILTRCVH